MQQQMEQPEEELKKMKRQLQEIEVERDRALDELGEMKKVAEEANMRLSEALSIQNLAEVQSELNSVDLLSKAMIELKSKEDNIESLKLELGKARDLELKLVENVETSEAHAKALLSEGEERIRELKLKQAENVETSVAHTKAVLSEKEERIRELELKLAKNTEAFEAHTKALLSQKEEQIRELELKLAENVKASKVHSKALLSENEDRVRALELKLAENVDTPESQTKALLSESKQRIRELELKLAENADTPESQTKALLSESKQRIRELEFKLEENVEIFGAHSKALLSDERIQELVLKLEENVETSEAHTKALLSESDKRIRELEMEIEKRKQSEARILDSLITQTNQLEQTKVLLEEAKLEMASLQKKLDGWEEESVQSSTDASTSQNQEYISTSHDNDNPESNHMMEELESLKSELHLTKESLVDAQKKEKLASSKAEKLIDEIGVLKRELKLTADAEENSKKAMDDLAFALKEVATEAKQLKDKLCMTQAELEHSRSQEERLNVLLNGNEESYKAVLDETRKEAERYKNTAARLKIEHEESVLAWSGKEQGFVDVIRKAEEDRYATQQENFRLHELLLQTDTKAMASKGENTKLRDILKQALNEANVAKEASAIAQAENSQLKDTLAEKEKALSFLARENESYRVNEIAANENIKELKRLLIESSNKETKKEEKDQKPPLKDSKKEAKEKTSSKELKKEVKKDSGKEKPSVSEESKKEDKEKTSSKEDKEVAAAQNGGILGKVFSFNLKEIKIPNTHDDAKTSNTQDNDADDMEIELKEALKDSIFEVNSPGSATHNRRHSSSFTDDGESIHSEDFDHLDGTPGDNSRKKKALLRRFGDLIKRSTTYSYTYSSAKKEPSTDIKKESKEPSPDTSKEVKEPSSE